MAIQTKRTILNGLGGAFLLWTGASIGTMATDGRDDIDPQFHQLSSSISGTVAERTPNSEMPSIRHRKNLASKNEQPWKLPKLFFEAAELTLMEAEENLMECEMGCSETLTELSVLVN